MVASHDLIEPAARRYGQTLADQARKHTPSFLDDRWWTTLLLDWGTRDDQFKVQLFRFVDVLPALITNEQFVRILQEYFGDLPSLPRPFRWLLARFSQNRVTAEIGTRLLRQQFLKMANTFMVGDSVEKAMPTLTRLWNTPCACSIDLLGEATVSETEAEQYHQRCLESLTQLHADSKDWDPQPLLEQDHLGPLPRIQLSIKLSALYSQLDSIDPVASYEGVAPRIRSILDLAQSLPASITFDMEQAELEPVILSIFTRILSEPAYRHFPHAGIALQAYLTHSPQSLDMLLHWGKTRPAPFGIRLVKGAYWDSEVIRYQQRGWEVPVFRHKNETDVNYECLAKRILEHHQYIRPAFGSHNIRTLSYIHGLAESLNLPLESYEFQMLYGMTEPLRDAVAAQGNRLRIYTPIGALIPGMAYLVRRLLENTSQVSFIRKQYESEESLDHILEPPPTGEVEEEPSYEELTSAPPEPESLPSSLPSAPIFFNEPHTDFSKPESHAPFREALHHVKSQLGQRYTYPVVGNIPCEGPELISINPSAPDQIVARFPTISPDHVGDLIQTASERLESWKTTPPDRRASILFKTATLMRKRRQELAAWEILETGKPWREADADVAEAIDFLEWYGREMEQLGIPRQLGNAPGEHNLRYVQPRGLAVVLPPWNFSLAIPTGMVAAALVTGNIVLFKPSERAPMMGYHLSVLLREAGLPEGIVHFLPGGPELGRTLVQSPAIHLIAFTGSQTVGTQLLQEMSHIAPGQRHVKHVIAEMGGKNAIIVDETADLDEAVLGVLASATGYQGQKCSACSRIIVLEPVYALFLARLRQAALSLRIGPPEDPEHHMGPLIDERALKHVRGYVERGKKDGTCILDRHIEGPGYFQGPVILADLPADHQVVQEEIFGPVMVILKARSIREALHLANDSPYALTGGIYSRSPANIQLAQSELEAGNVYINRPITGSLVGRQPFGGHRLSGIGRKAGGQGYLEQFMIEKVVTENTLRRGFAPTQ